MSVKTVATLVLLFSILIFSFSLAESELSTSKDDFRKGADVLSGGPENVANNEEKNTAPAKETDTTENPDVPQGEQDNTNNERNLAAETLRTALPTNSEQVRNQVFDVIVQSEMSKCGNGQVEEGETVETCCYDIPCPDGLGCFMGLCVETNKVNIRGINYLLRDPRVFMPREVSNTTMVKYVFEDNRIREGSFQAAEFVDSTITNFRRLSDCYQCLIELTIGNDNSTCARCDEAMAFTSITTLGILNVDKDDFIAACGEFGYTFSEDLKIPPSLIMSFLVFLMFFIANFCMSMQYKINEIEESSQGKLVTLAAQGDEILNTAHGADLLDTKIKEQTGQGSDQTVYIMVKIEYAFYTLMTLFIGMFLIYGLMGFLFNETMPCMELGIRIVLAFIWCFFLVYMIAEAVTGFGVENISDADIDAYVQDEYANVDESNASPEAVMQKHKNDAANKLRADPAFGQNGKDKVRASLKAALGQTKTRDGRYAPGFYYLEDFMGLPHFLAKLIIDPFRLGITRFFMVLMMFEMFSPVSLDILTLIKLDALAIFSYIMLLLGWYLKYVFVMIFTWVATFVFFMFDKFTGAFHSAASSTGRKMT